MAEEQSNGKKIALISLLGVFIAILGIALFWRFNPKSARSMNSSSPTFLVSNATAEVGGEVYVSVAVDNNPGIAGFLIDLEYDQQMLKPLEIVQGDIISNGLFNSDLDQKTSAGLIKTVWFDANDMPENGELYAVKFRVLAKEGGATPVKIGYEEGNVANQSLENVAFQLKSAEVTITS